MVEILSTCPTNWGMEPLAALRWLEEKMTAYYPLRVFKNRTKDVLRINPVSS
jgi:2-oxoglutarate/2-oxoacid ferredoxin oxidoreductase subunit beta